MKQSCCLFLKKKTSIYYTEADCGSYFTTLHRSKQQVKEKERKENKNKTKQKENINVDVTAKAKTALLCNTLSE